MFKSKAELAVALTSGRRFRTFNGDLLHYNASKLNPFRTSIGGKEYLMEASWEYYASVTEVEDWTANLPVLCHVWDTRPENAIVALVTKYDSNIDFTYPYETDGGVEWVYATPLTPAEVGKYVYKEI